MPNELSDFNYFSIIADKNNGVFGKLRIFGNVVSGIFAVSLLLTFPVDFLGIIFIFSIYRRESNLILSYSCQDDPA